MCNFTPVIRNKLTKQLEIMRTTKVFTATLKRDLNEDNKKGKTLRLEFELDNKVCVLANNDWGWELDTLGKDEVDSTFENLNFLQTNVWKKV